MYTIIEQEGRQFIQLDAIPLTVSQLESTLKTISKKHSIILENYFIVFLSIRKLWDAYNFHTKRIIVLNAGTIEQAIEIYSSFLQKTYPFKICFNCEAHYRPQMFGSCPNCGKHPITNDVDQEEFY